MSANRKKKLKAEWLKKAEQKIIAKMHAKPADKPKPVLPGGALDAGDPVQKPLDTIAGREEEPPIEANGVRTPPHTYSAHVREKECLKAFGEGVKNIEVECKGKFIQEFVMSRRAGRYKPRIRFYLATDEANSKKDEEVLALEKAANDRLNALCASLAEKWLGTFRLVMIGAQPEQDGSGEGEYCGQVQFVAQ